ncbi:MAG: PEP-utilizing enzyme [Caldilinea sp.]|nr:PEP-utilizing enzyme [Caldilinea sp.]
MITDSGGALSHSAVIAREYGIPAVVGAGTATRRLMDGEMVEVNGHLGIVRIGE